MLVFTRLKNYINKKDLTGLSPNNEELLDILIGIIYKYKYINVINLPGRFKKINIALYSSEWLPEDRDMFSEEYKNAYMIDSHHVKVQLYNDDIWYYEYIMVQTIIPRKLLKKPTLKHIEKPNNIIYCEGYTL